MGSRSLPSLIFRNLLFTILQPGLVAGFFPYLIIKNDLLTELHWQVHSYVAAGLFIFGLIILLYCIAKFAIDGRGTLSPAYPTQKLVITGMYKYTRNPMYLSVLLMLLGETIFFTSAPLLLYTAAVLSAFTLFIIFFEEPRLRRDFGEDYITYCKNVRRWF